MIVSPLTTEAAANGSSAASDFGNHSVIRAINTATAVALVTKTNAAGTVLGTMTLAAGESANIYKAKTDKLFAAAATVLFAAVDHRG
tara:strand:- start:58 stop:318 length:261 start_codon:yes stop_codon:yes gene_type:complete